MIDSTNPRILANNIKKLFARINAIVPGTVVTGNPSGSGFNTLLTKIKIGDSKYKLPDAVIGNPEDEATEALTKLKVGNTTYNLSSYTPPNYSTTEFNTGKKWIDNRDIYGIVYDLAEAINVNYNAFTSLGITNLGSITIINGFAISNSNYNVPGVMLQNDSGTLKAQVPRLGNVQTPIKTVYIEYVKNS